MVSLKNGSLVLVGTLHDGGVAGLLHRSIVHGGRELPD
jgi:hypothetical protein